MLAEPGEVGKSKWKFGFNLLMQNRLQTFAFYFTDTGFLIEKQAQLGNEADVRKRYLAIHKELVIGRQRLVYAAGKDRESITHPRVNLRRKGPVDQGQQVDLRVACKHQAHIKETVDPRRFIRSVAV